MKPLLQNNKTVLFCLGCLSALAMAPAYLWPLMIIGYSYYTYVIINISSFKYTVIYTFLFFLGYFLTGLYWTSSSLFIEFDKWWWALPFSFLGLPILLSCIPALIIGFTAYLKYYRFLFVLIAMIVSDIFRSFIFTGFPWNMPAYTWTGTDLIMQLLPIIGIFGLNSLTIAFMVIPAAIVLYLKKYKVILTVYSILCITLMLWPNTSVNNNISLPNNVIMVQANIPQVEKWDYSFVERNLDRYINMSLDAISHDSSVILIWPETAISQSLLSYPKLKQKFYNFLYNLPQDSILITGYLYSTKEGFFNAIAILDRHGDILDIYNKHHLVPFGEYMPFGLDTLTGVSNFQRGMIPKTLNTKATKLEIFPLICYEVIFPQYAKRATKNSIIVNVTNDAWFGQTAGPYQHFDNAIFRARENEIPVFRLSGNGLSAIILPNGHIYKSSLLNKRATITSMQ